MAKKATTREAIYSEAFKEAGTAVSQIRKPNKRRSKASQASLGVNVRSRHLYEAKGIDSLDTVWLGRLEKLQKALESATAKVSKAADSLSARTVQLGLGLVD